MGLSLENRVDQKVTIRMTGGYSVTSSDPLTFLPHQKLWFNSELNLYILRISPTTEQMGTYRMSIQGLVNPEPYLKELYEKGNTI